MQRAAVIVCPTEYGGHLLHASEIAAAFSRDDEFSKVILVSRPGARSAIADWREDFEVDELISPRRTGGPLKPLRQIIDVSRDRRRLRLLVAEASKDANVTAVHEVARYGVMPKAHNILFVHNAVSHEAVRPTLRSRYLAWQQRRVSRRFDCIFVHGRTQREEVQRWTTVPVISVELPGNSRASATGDLDPAIAQLVSSGGFALCLGEVRRNKGIENAIGAAKVAGRKLVIAGAPEDSSYAAQLRTLAGDHDDTLLVLRFLTEAEYSALLAAADVVLLPYISFGAQSGVLAQAMQLGKRLIATDLPSLREQAEGYIGIDFVPVGSEAQLADKLGYVPAQTESAAQLAGKDARAGWDRIAQLMANGEVG